MKRAAPCPMSHVPGPGSRDPCLTLCLSCSPTPWAVGPRSLRPPTPAPTVSLTSLSLFSSISDSSSSVSSPSVSVWSSRSSSWEAVRWCSQGTRTSLCRRDSTCTAAEAPHWARLL